MTHTDPTPTRQGQTATDLDWAAIRGHAHLPSGILSGMA